VDALQARIPGAATVKTDPSFGAALSYSISGTDLVILITLGMNGTGIIAKTKDLSASDGGFTRISDLDEDGARRVAAKIVEWWGLRAK
jgi:hypothetical protein